VKSTLRFLLVCYLLLALPFQAFAAASMRLPAAVTQTAPATKQLPPCHQQMAMDHAMDHGQAPMAKAAPGDHQGDQHGAQHAKDKCGSCAACSVGAAMAPSLPAPLALAPPSAVSIPFRAGHLPSVDPVLPERPPSILPA
jgi:hypothetical protein